GLQLFKELSQHNQVKAISVVGPIDSALATALREGHLFESLAFEKLVAIVLPTIPPHKPPYAPVLLDPVVMQKVDRLILAH
ncbi:6538_t:CDS:1, partial [Racocetra fulgida]